LEILSTKFTVLGETKMTPTEFLKFLKENDVSIALEMSRKDSVSYDKAFYSLYHEVIYPLMDSLREKMN
jgi:hypothetical protein